MNFLGIGKMSESEHFDKPDTLMPGSGGEMLSPFFHLLPVEKEIEVMGELGVERDVHAKDEMEAVRALFIEDSTDVKAKEEETDEEIGEIDEADVQRRTEKLRSITLSLDRLWWAGQEELAKAAQVLADGSRDARWRIPYGNSGLLDAFLIIIRSADITTTLRVHALRLIGNSCADTDENRARVVAKDSLSSIITLLKDQTLVPFAIPVLFNICFDYETAQEQASECGLSTALVELASSPSFEEYRPFLGYACRLLGMIATQPGELARAPEETVSVLFNLAESTTSDVEDFITLVSTAAKYLKDPRFQHAICHLDGMHRALDVLKLSCELEDLDEDEQKSVSALRDELNSIFSDISDLPQFATICQPASPIFTTLKKWLSSPHQQLQVCGAIMLGNLARSDAACLSFVKETAIHKPLITIVSHSNSSQTLYAALGFLKNLALPAPNKTALGETGVIEVLLRIWAMDSLPQIQYSAVSLARQLMISNPSNVQRIIAPLSSDTDSPASEKSRLSVLVSLFSRTDTEPVKMEISRLLCAVARALSTQDSHAKSSFFSKHHDIAKPLSFMATQKKWPAIRSEGWFILAMLARSPESVSIVDDVLRDPEVYALLAEVMASSSGGSGEEKAISPVGETANMLEGMMMSDGQSLQPTEPKARAQGEEMKRVDRENALVLVSEVLRHRGSEMGDMRRSAFEGLVRDGGSALMNGR